MTAQLFNPAKQAAAHELAQLLSIARSTVRSRVQRWCYRCGSVNIHPSYADPLRCWRCAIRADDAPPSDAPGSDCGDHGPSSDDGCPKC